MPSWKTPTPETVERAVASMVHLEQQRYFFERLLNPLWLEPLRKKRFFSTPPEPKRDSAQGTIEYQMWPAGRYLARMAAHATQAQVVAEILMEVPDIDNPFIVRDFLEAGIAMPATVASKLAAKISKLIKTPFLIRGDLAGEFATHLARGGEHVAALTVLQAALEVIPDPRPIPEELKRFDPDYKYEARSRIRTFEYQLILQRHTAELSQLLGISFFTFLCDLLHRALDLEFRPSPDSGRIEDYSYIWRPHLSSSARSDSVKDLLPSAVLSSADHLVADSPALLGKINEMLTARRYKLFERVGIEVITRHLEIDSAAVARKLVDRELFDDVGVRAEYYALAEKGYALLKESEQRQILKWIDEGLDCKLLQERFGLSLEEAERQIDYWRLERLQPIREHLSDPWRERYETLEKKFGVPRHPAHAVVTGGAFAMSSKSPQQERDLEPMTAEGVIQFVKSWRPPNEPSVPFGPSEEGLAAVLTGVVHKRALEFSQQSREFKSADPTYVRAAIQGFESATREKVPFDWARVLDLCAWTVSQPIEIPGRTGDPWTRDPDWRSARQAVIGLIDEGFKQKTIPFELRGMLWTVLENLSEGDNLEAPPYDDEDSQKRDIWSASINRAKPRAIRAVVKYIEWYRDNAGSKEFSLTTTPEAASLLDCHLNPDVDPSLDVRLIYGEFLPFLLHVDNHWVAQHIEKIFPEDHSLKPLRDVAWAAYLVANPAYDTAFRILRPFYSSAVDEIGKPRLTGSGHLLYEPDVNLANHLMQLYWRGRITLDPGELLDRFNARASDELIGRMVEYVGRSMSESKEQIPAEVLDRLQRLWAQRLQQVMDKQHPKEMAAFGWWFNSGYFEDAWALDHLHQSLLRSSGAMEPKLDTLQRLARLAEKYPSAVIVCTEMIVNAELIDVILWVEDLKRILSTVIRVGDAEASKTAGRLIHSLGSRGYHEYRELLQQP